MSVGSADGKLGGGCSMLPAAPEAAPGEGTRFVARPSTAATAAATIAAAAELAAVAAATAAAVAAALSASPYRIVGRSLGEGRHEEEQELPDSEGLAEKREVSAMAASIWLAWTPAAPPGGTRASLPSLLAAKEISPDGFGSASPSSDARTLRPAARAAAAVGAGGDIGTPIEPRVAAVRRAQ